MRIFTQGRLHDRSNVSITEQLDVFDFWRILPQENHEVDADRHRVAAALDCRYALHLIPCVIHQTSNGRAYLGRHANRKIQQPLLLIQLPFQLLGMVFGRFGLITIIPIIIVLFAFAYWSGFVNYVIKERARFGISPAWYGAVFADPRLTETHIGHH